MSMKSTRPQGVAFVISWFRWANAPLAGINKMCPGGVCTSVQHPLGWCDGCHRTKAPVRTPHTSYRWRVWLTTVWVPTCGPLFGPIYSTYSYVEINMIWINLDMWISVCHVSGQIGYSLECEFYIIEKAMVVNYVNAGGHFFWAVLPSLQFSLKFVYYYTVAVG